MALALIYLTSFGGEGVWKGMDWDVMNLDSPRRQPVHAVHFDKGESLIKVKS